MDYFWYYFFHYTVYDNNDKFVDRFMQFLTNGQVISLLHILQMRKILYDFCNEFCNENCITDAA